MSNAFLVQIALESYERLTTQREYYNPNWHAKKRDTDHGEIQPGDSVFFYCTGEISQYPRSLAFVADVESESADKTLLKFGEVRRLPALLTRDRIRQLVANGDLEEAFRSCGAQGFNVTKLEPESASKILQLAQSGEGALAAKGSPLEDLIETKLEDYIVENWSQIAFGSNLRVYTEDGQPVGQQYDTDEIGRIDILCEDEDTHDIVVIELKRGRSSDEVVGQLARYMGWATERIANGRMVRGIILAPDFDAKLRYAVKVIPGAQLLKYRTRFEVEPA